MNDDREMNIPSKVITNEYALQSSMPSQNSDRKIDLVVEVLDSSNKEEN